MLRSFGVFVLAGLFVTPLCYTSPISTEGYKQLVFRQKVLSTQKTDGIIDVVLVIDESNSISDVDFDVARVACQQVVEQYDGLNVQFGVVLFSDEPRIISPLTTDRASVLQAINEVSRRPGSTNTRAALSSAKQLFQDYGRRDAHRVVFLITDGRPNQSPVSEAFELRIRLQATVFAIGVGQVDEKNLEEVASKGYSFHVADFEDLVKLLAPPARPADATMRHRVSFQSFLRKFPLTTRESIPIRFTVRNQRPADIPAGSRLFFRADPYLEPYNYFLTSAVAPYVQFSADIDLPVTARASIATLPETISVLLESPDGAEIPAEFASIELSPEDFVGDLVAAKPSDPDLLAFNVLVFGLVGHGKSSWINAVVTGLSHRIQDLAAVGGTGGHVTTQLVRFSLPGLHRNSPEVPPVPVNFWDTWGVTATNYNEDFLRELLEGKLPSGYKMTDRVDLSAAGVQEYLAKVDPRDREMHALVFLVHAGFEDDVNQTRRMTNCSALATRLGFSPIVVVTGMDKHQPSMHSRIRTVTSEIFAIPPNRVFLVTNYVNQPEKVFAIDKANMEIVQQLLRIADSKVARRLLHEADAEATLPRAERRAMRLLREAEQAKLKAQLQAEPVPLWPTEETTPTLTVSEVLDDEDEEDDLRRPDYKIAQEHLRAQQYPIPELSLHEKLAKIQENMQSRIHEHVAALHGASASEATRLQHHHDEQQAANARAIQDAVRDEIAQQHTRVAELQAESLRRHAEAATPQQPGLFGAQQPGVLGARQRGPVGPLFGGQPMTEERFFREQQERASDFMARVRGQAGAPAADAAPENGRPAVETANEPLSPQTPTDWPFPAPADGSPKRVRDILNQMRQEHRPSRSATASKPDFIKDLESGRIDAAAAFRDRVEAHRKATQSTDTFAKVFGILAAIGAVAFVGAYFYLAASFGAEPAARAAALLPAAAAVADALPSPADAADAAIDAIDALAAADAAEIVGRPGARLERRPMRLVQREPVPVARPASRDNDDDQSTARFHRRPEPPAQEASATDTEEPEESASAAEYAAETDDTDAASDVSDADDDDAPVSELDEMQSDSDVEPQPPIQDAAAVVASSLSTVRRPRSADRPATDATPCEPPRPSPPPLSCADAGSTAGTYARMSQPVGETEVEERPDTPPELPTMHDVEGLPPSPPVPPPPTPEPASSGRQTPDPAADDAASPPPPTFGPGSEDVLPSEELHLSELLQSALVSGAFSSTDSGPTLDEFRVSDTQPEPSEGFIIVDDYSADSHR